MSLPIKIAGLLGGAFVALASPGALGAPADGLFPGLPEPDRWFITQNHHPLYHPEPAAPYNSNCGPAALAMALKAFGLAPAEVGARGLISLARRTMTGSDADGTWTYPDQIAEAAQVFGLEARPVWGLSGIRSALSRPGRLVVVNLNPGGVYDHLLGERYRGGHFTVVVADRGSELVLNDPLAERPALPVPVKAFRQALLTDLGPGRPAYGGGIELWRPGAPGRPGGRLPRLPGRGRREGPVGNGGVASAVHGAR